MANGNKPQRMVTPVGEAKWPHLNKPKPPFEGRGPAKYQVDVVFDPRTSPEWKAWATEFKARFNALAKKSPDNFPIKKELDENDQETGRFYFTAKTGEQFKPFVCDRYGKPIPEDVNVGNGSQVRLSYIENVYEGFGGGINLYLNAVQVIELVAYQGKNAAAYGFEVEEEPVAELVGVSREPGSDDDEGMPF
jgi:hypothetical protein